MEVSGNGADLGAIYQAVLAVAAELRAFRAEVTAEFGKVRAEFNSEFGKVRAEIADLRQTVADYHEAVIGHCVPIGELDERVSRLEQEREPPEAA